MEKGGFQKFPAVVVVLVQPCNIILGGHWRYWGRLA
jgi:hypothetical protein